MSGTTVNLDDVCNYLINVANNHSQRVTRSLSPIHGQSEEQVTFVLRRCVDELHDQYGALRNEPYDGLGIGSEPKFAAAPRTATTPVSNQTYRNRATS
jgi:hypothetical protein